MKASREVLLQAAPPDCPTCGSSVDVQTYECPTDVGTYYEAECALCHEEPTKVLGTGDTEDAALADWTKRARQSELERLRDGEGGEE